MGLIDDLEKKYGAAPATPARSLVDELEAKYAPARPAGDMAAAEGAGARARSNVATPGPTTSLRFPGTGEDEPGPIHDDSFMSMADRLIFDVVGPRVYDAAKEGQRKLREGPQARQSPWESEAAAPASPANLPPSPLLSKGERADAAAASGARRERVQKDADATQALNAQVEGGKVAGNVSTGIALGGGLPGVAAAATGRSLAPVVAPAATTLGRIFESAGKGAAGSTATQVAEDVGNGVPLREMPGRALHAAGAGAATGGLLQAGGELAQPTAKKLGVWSNQKLVTAEAKDIIANADPTHARRAVGRAGETAEPLVEFVRRHPEVEKAVKPGGMALADAAEAAVNRAAAPTPALYQRFDRVGGKVPVRDVVGKLDEAIAAEHTYDGSPLLERSLKEVRDRVISVAGGEDAIKTAEMSHKELRGWVTRLLKDEQATMGGIAETEKYALKDALHRTGDEILKERLASVAAAKPELAGDLAKLQAANLDIAMGLRVQQAAENAAARVYWQRQSQLGDRVAAGIGALVGFGGAGPLAGIAAAGVAKAAPVAWQGSKRVAMTALNDLAKAVASGKGTDEAIAAAIASGVPRSIAEGVAKKRQSPAEDQP